MYGYMHGHICYMYVDQFPRIVYVLYVTEDIQMKFTLALGNFYEVSNVQCKIHLKTVPIDVIGRKFPQLWDIYSENIHYPNVVVVMKLDSLYITMVRLTRAGDVTQDELRYSCGN